MSKFGRLVTTLSVGLVAGLVCSMVIDAQIHSVPMIPLVKVLKLETPHLINSVSSVVHDIKDLVDFGPLSWPLRISVSDGSLPTTVTVTDSRVLEAAGAMCEAQAKYSWVDIDWGDGTRGAGSGQVKRGDGCRDRQPTHNYTVPGLYTVSAYSGHIGPDDGPVTEWKLETTVNVTGAAEDDEISVTGMDKPEYGYREDMTVSWHATVSTLSSVRVELIDGLGVVRCRHDRPLATNGDGHDWLQAQMEPGILDGEIRDGKAVFKARVSIVRDGAVIKSSTSEPFRMTPLRAHPGRFLDVVPSSVPNEVVLTFHTYLPACFSYRLDWGDGQQTVEQKPLLKGCTVGFGSETAKHVYARPGPYAIKVTTSEGDEFRPLADMVSYFVEDVTAR